MSKSPGHREWPEHQVREEPVKERLQVRVGGETIAESNQVIRVVEDSSPPRYYFPRSDVKMDKLQRTQTTSECPFKGTARYFTLNAGGQALQDAVWSYEQPYEEHEALQDRVAFYDDKMPQIEVRPA